MRSRPRPIKTKHVGSLDAADNVNVHERPCYIIKYLKIFDLKVKSEYLKHPI
jgi:hypothetical protein